MCGIVAYIGFQPAAPIIFKCLEKLEYRGYDSCGIAISTGRSLSVEKDALRVSELQRYTLPLEGKIGVGHTRWATCGEPSRANAHPHVDCLHKIAVVHNGNIENFEELRKALIEEGHVFSSETDTEVLPHLIEKYYDGELGQAVARAIKDITGSFAIAVIRAGEDKVVLAKQKSPLVVGLIDKEYIAASDTAALLDYTDRVVYLEEGDVCNVTTEGVELYRNGVLTDLKEERIAWKPADTKLGGFNHYMMKEIHEQPRVITDTLASFEGVVDQLHGLLAPENNAGESLLMVACGTSYHSAMLGKYISEELLGIPVRAELASEINYCSNVITSSIAIAISQSGETADTLQAVRRIKATGCKVMSITNVEGSQLSRLSDFTIYTKAGPEMSVASTKTFSAQAALLYAICISRSEIDESLKKDLEKSLSRVPMLVRQFLNEQSNIEILGKYLAKFNNALFVARGVNYPVALEGALKLKEISYIHGEGYAAGELKHGPFALLDANTPAIAIVAQDRTYNAMLANIREIKTRKAPVIAIVEEGDKEVTDLADMVIEVPHVDPFFSPMLNVVALQLLAYYTALARGCPIDFPRNLAKTVTVE
jgi:glucosamine--fructose-6-phosphate aminotransferase (isomerizing)